MPENGAEVPPGVLIDSAGFRDALSREQDIARGRRRWRYGVTVGLLVVLVVGAAVFRDHLFGGLCALVAILDLVLIRLYLRWLTNEKDDLRHLERVAPFYGWAEWNFSEVGRGKCIVLRDVGGEKAGVIQLNRKLDAPSGDGGSLGKIWFAGDIRFGGVLRRPGSSGMRFGRGIPSEAVAGTADENRLAQAADLITIGQALGLPGRLGADALGGTAREVGRGSRGAVDPPSR
jgi:hypothetical protein